MGVIVFTIALSSVNIHNYNSLFPSQKTVFNTGIAAILGQHSVARWIVISGGSAGRIHREVLIPGATMLVTPSPQAQLGAPQWPWASPTASFRWINTLNST